MWAFYTVLILFSAADPQPLDCRSRSTTTGRQLVSETEADKYKI